MFSIHPAQSLREGLLYEVVRLADGEDDARYCGVFRLVWLDEEEKRCTLEIDEDTWLSVRLDAPSDRFQFYEALED